SYTRPPENAMSRLVTVAATQMSCSWDRQANIARAEKLVRQAAAQGAQIILIQELFETPYFCQKPNPEYLQMATPTDENPAIKHFQAIARELQVVLPISFFELAGRARFNSIAIIDADGRILGVYRKSHIPDGPGYHEKYYFNPGDTGFKVWKTRFATIGVGICWDQWFPECARAMALQGAEILFYPTAIGSEPHDASITSKDHWQRVQQGHAGANLMPLVASNRVGREEQDGYDITFYGASFIADQFGEKVQEANGTDETVLVQQFDLDQLEHIRAAWGVFRDRRPNLYRPLKTLDGSLESRFMYTLHSTPRADGFYMPAEWAPNSQTWMLWPERPDNWRLAGKPAQAAFAEVARAIAGFEPVTVGVSAAQYANASAQLDH